MLFHIGVATLRRWTTSYRQSETVAPKRADHSNHPKKLNEEALQFLRGLLDVGCDATDEELADRLREEKGVHVSRQTVNRAVNRMGYTRKKDVHCHRTHLGAGETASGGVRGGDGHRRPGTGFLHR